MAEVRTHGTADTSIRTSRWMHSLCHRRCITHGDQGYRCRVRVWPVGGDRQFAVATPVIDYDWLLTRQPEDAAEHSGCWMVDGVMPDRDAWERALDLE